MVYHIVNLDQTASVHANNKAVGMLTSPGG